MNDFHENSYVYVPATREQIIRFTPAPAGEETIVPMLDEEGRLFRVNAKTKIMDHNDENSAADYLMAYKKQCDSLISTLVDLEVAMAKAPSRTNCALVLDYEGAELSVTSAELKVARREITSIFVNNVATIAKAGKKKVRVAPILLAGALYSFLKYLYTTDRAALGLYNYDPDWEYAPDAECPEGNQFTTAYLESTLSARVFEKNAIMSLITRYNKVVNGKTLAENGNKDIVIDKVLAAFFGSYEVYSDLFESEEEYQEIVDGYDTRAPFVLDEAGQSIVNTEDYSFSALDYFYTAAVNSYEKNPKTAKGRDKPIPDQNSIRMNELMAMNSALVISAPSLKKHGRQLQDAGFFDGMVTDKRGGFSLKGAMDHLRSDETKKIAKEFAAVVSKPSVGVEVSKRSPKKASAAKLTKPKKYAIA